MENKDKIILDLCGGTGAWSKPYKDAGYDVKNITLPEFDVRIYQPPDSIYGILAAPPCNTFCRMRMCHGKPTDDEFIRALEVVSACARIILICKPKFWALENPQGYLKRWLGKPKMKFDPCDFGDPWTKRTWLWGEFIPPMPLFTSARVTHPTGQWVNDNTNNGLSKTPVDNAITPAKFAQAFYEANK